MHTPNLFRWHFRIPSVGEKSPLIRSWSCLSERSLSSRRWSGHGQVHRRRSFSSRRRRQSYPHLLCTSTTLLLGISTHGWGLHQHGTRLCCCASYRHGTTVSTSDIDPGMCFLPARYQVVYLGFTHRKVACASTVQLCTSGTALYFGFASRTVICTGAVPRIYAQECGLYRHGTTVSPRIYKQENRRTGAVHRGTSDLHSGLWLVPAL